MIMLTEDYCSFELSKLLKEKGFDEKCPSYYRVQDSKIDLLWNHFEGKLISNSELNQYFVSAPTHQMAMKWLRDVHNKYCDIGYDIDLGWFFQIIDLKETVEYDYPETKYYHTENEIGFNSYEEAVEAALKYCLTELI